MKKKSILVIAVVILLLLVFCVMFFSKSDKSNPETEETLPPQTMQPTVQPTEATVLEIIEEGRFAFTASQFWDRFNNTLPEGYTFTDVTVGNDVRGNKLQLNVLFSDGEDTGIAVLMDVKEHNETFHQMALTIKVGEFEEDAVAMIRWFVSTFFVDFDETERENIIQDYLDMYQSGDDDYRLYAEDTQVVMMQYGKEGTEAYYYVMVSLQ